MSAVALALAVAGCSSGSSDSGDSDATDSADSAEPTDSSDATGSTDAEPSSSTSSSSTTTPSTTSSTTTSTTTTEPADTEPPPGPANVVCGPGGGSGEFDISWDAPGPGDEEITRFRIYVNEDGAGFTSLNNLVVADGAIEMTRDGGTRWAGTAYPIPAFAPLEIAVTAFDDDGNESGWNPIDAYYGGGALPCNSGPPPAPSLASIHRGAGSGEIDIEVTPPAADVVDYSVSADISGTGYVALTVLVITDSSLTPGNSRVTAVGSEWSVPVDYQVIAIDAHGNPSPASTKSCAAIPNPADVC